MSNNLPRRGPRQLNGFGKMMAQARQLPHAAAPDNSALAAHAQMQADIAALLGRCKTAEKQVGDVRAVVANFRKQALLLPVDHPVRKIVDQMLTTLERCVA
jgi:hypothetical protein